MGACISIRLHAEPDHTDHRANPRQKDWRQEEKAGKQHLDVQRGHVEEAVASRVTFIDAPLRKEFEERLQKRLKFQDAMLDLKQRSILGRMDIDEVERTFDEVVRGAGINKYVPDLEKRLKSILNTLYKEQQVLREAQEDLLALEALDNMKAQDLYLPYIVDQRNQVEKIFNERKIFLSDFEYQKMQWRTVMARLHKN